MKFYLMNLDEEYGTFDLEYTINDKGDREYSFPNCHVTEPDLQPYFVDKKLGIPFWIKIRPTINSADDTLRNIREKGYILEDIEWLFKNFGANIDDGYWFRPEVLPDLKYEDIEILKNYTGLIPEIPYSEYSKKGPHTEIDIDNTKICLNIYDNICEFQKQYLISKKWQALNELFVRFVHDRQKNNIVMLDVRLRKNSDRLYLDSLNFVKEGYNVIYAYQLYDNNNSTTMFYQFFHQLTKIFKMDSTLVQEYLDYMIVLDYLLSNSDRGGQNYGIQQSQSTKECELIPLFDYERTMGYDEYAQLLKIKDQPKDYQEMVKKLLFDQNNSKLYNVKDKNIIKLDLLPTVEEVKGFYQSFNELELSEEELSFVLEIYEYKKNYLKEWQQGN